MSAQTVQAEIKAHNQIIEIWVVVIKSFDADQIIAKHPDVVRVVRVGISKCKIVNLAVKPTVLQS